MGHLEQGDEALDRPALGIVDDLNGSATWQSALVIGPLDEVRITTAAGSDFEVDNVEIVPEPGTAISLLFGAGMLAALARRREQ